MQTEEPWAAVTQHQGPLPALDMRRSSDIVPSEIFSHSLDMSLGLSEEQQSHLAGAAVLQQPGEVFAARPILRGSANQRPVLHGYPVTGSLAASRQSTTSQQPDRPQDLLPEQLRSHLLAPGPSGFHAPSDRQPLRVAAHRSTPSFHGTDTHDGSSSTGSRNSPQVPLFRSQVGAPSGVALQGSPLMPVALRGRSNSTSAIPRGRASSRVSKFDHCVFDHLCCSICQIMVAVHNTLIRLPGSILKVLASCVFFVPGAAVS